MSRLLGFLLFLAFLILLDIYVFQSIRTVAKNLTKRVKYLIYSAYWLLSIFVFLGFVFFFLTDAYRFGVLVRSLTSGLFFTLFLTKFCVAIFLLFDDTRRLFRWVNKKIAKRKESNSSSGGNAIPRSEFLVKTGMMISALPFVSMTGGILYGVHDYRVKKITLPVKNLPQEFNGVTIAQISDIHAGSFFSASGVKKGVSMLMEQKPDMIFFTGDLVNMRSEEVFKFIPIFKELSAPLGVYSILGNHDYGNYVKGWTAYDREKNMDRMKKAHADMGWDLLLNENRVIRKGGGEIALIGVENWGRGEQWPKYGDLGKAYKGVEHLPFKMLLSHDPSHWGNVVVKDFKDIDMTFSGHTHGFQFGLSTPFFKWSPVQYVYEHWSGLYENQGQHLYVNIGFGFIGFPGRVGMPPEITIFELQKA